MKSITTRSPAERGSNSNIIQQFLAVTFILYLAATLNVSAQNAESQVSTIDPRSAISDIGILLSSDSIEVITGFTPSVGDLYSARVTMTPKSEMIYSKPEKLFMTLTLKLSVPNELGKRRLSDIKLIDGSGGQHEGYLRGSTEKFIAGNLLTVNLSAIDSLTLIFEVPKAAIPNAKLSFFGLDVSLRDKLPLIPGRKDAQQNGRPAQAKKVKPTRTEDGDSSKGRNSK